MHRKGCTIHPSQAPGPTSERVEELEEDGCEWKCSVCTQPLVHDGTRTYFLGVMQVFQSNAAGENRLVVPEMAEISSTSPASRKVNPRAICTVNSLSSCPCSSLDDSNILLMVMCSDLTSPCQVDQWQGPLSQQSSYPDDPCQLPALPSTLGELCLSPTNQ